MTREPYLYRKLYQNKFRSDDTKIFQIFGVPIGNAKITRKTVPPSGTSDEISPKDI